MFEIELQKINKRFENSGLDFILTEYDGIFTATIQSKGKVLEWWEGTDGERLLIEIQLDLEAMGRSLGKGFLKAFEN